MTSLKLKWCPNNPNHKTFVTTAHEVHEWVVDEAGNFISDRGCIEVAHSPNKSNIWTCSECGVEAVGFCPEYGYLLPNEVPKK